MSAELMKSKFVRRPSGRRPSVASIISEAIVWISFKFLVVASPGSYAQTFFFLIFEEIFFFFYYFFTNIFRFR